MTSEEWRYIAQRVPSREFIDWNLPLTGVEITRSLSAPGRLSGKVPVDIARMKASDGRPLLDEWGTMIFAEASGEIRGGGILVDSEFAEDGSWQIDCMGFAGYPEGMPWLGPDRSYVRRDPADIFREIWAHVQSQPNGNLGVIVDNTTTTARIGTPKDDDDGDGPYELLFWEARNLGARLDELAIAGSFDYIEETRWKGGGEELEHRLRLYHPYRGRRRHDLNFTIGVNVALPDLWRGGDNYADEVFLMGAGEGRDMITGHQVQRTNRLRRVAVVDRKEIGRKDTANREARAELMLRAGLENLDVLTVYDHPNAPLGSFDIGDEIFVQGDTGWFDVGMWVRVMEITFRPESLASMELTVARSEVIA